MNTKPLSYVLTFILGAATMRLIGFFFLGYSGTEYSHPIGAANSAGIAGAAFMCSSLLLAYIAFVRMPSIHAAVRKALSYFFTATGSVCLWRLYAFSRGSRLPFGTVANNIAIVSAGLLVSIIVLVLLAMYKEKGNTDVAD